MTRAKISPTVRHRPLRRSFDNLRDVVDAVNVQGMETIPVPSIPVVTEVLTELFHRPLCGVVRFFVAERIIPVPCEQTFGQVHQMIMPDLRGRPRAAVTRIRDIMLSEVRDHLPQHPAYIGVHRPHVPVSPTPLRPLT